MSLVETTIDAVPKCVFTRMDCLEKKYPEIFTINEKLDMSYDFCLTHKNEQDFGNGQFFTHVEDLIGSGNLQKLVEYKNIKGIWNIIRTIGSPTLYDKDNDIEYEGHLYLKELKKEDFLTKDVKPFYGSKIETGETSVRKAEKRMKEAEEAHKQVKQGNLPEIAVSSSNVMSRTVRNNKLYVRFHSSPEDSYKYIFKSNEEALKAADELTQESPGRYVWKNLRGKKLGPVFGKSNKLTPGGTSASIVPYDKSKYSRIKQHMGRIPEFEKKVGSIEELAEKMRQFKVGVKGEDVPKEEKEPGELEAKGTSGAPFRGGELEKYQRRIYEEKKKRRGVKDEAKAMLERLKERKKHDLITETDKSDFHIQDTIGICDDCKEKKDLYYQKLCKDCYQKRVDNYVDKYDMLTEDSFDDLTEIIELEKELEKYDFHIEDHLEEFYDFIENDYTVEGYNRTSKLGNRHWVEKHTREEGTTIREENLKFYSVEEVNEALKLYGTETSPWFKIDKNIDIKSPYSGAWQLANLAKSMHLLPLGIKNMIKEIRIYDKGVGSDPYFTGKQNEVPQAYQKVGSDRTWGKIGGVYIHDKNIAILGANSKFSSHTLRHEIGHAVWYEMSGKDQNKFIDIFNELSNQWINEPGRLGKVNLIRIKRGDYEANDVKEFFAESFQHYYYARAYKARQKQGFGDVSKFFRERMRKYE